MVVSGLLVAAVLGYMTWQAIALPGEDRPRVEVVGLETLPGGEVHVHVRVAHDASAGLREVEVEVDCDDPPPSVRLSNVPARGERRATLACPAGTTEANATLASMIRT